MYYARKYYSNESAKIREKKPSIFIYPKKTSKFTHLKAPMAHKTFSQEQFKSKFYFLSTSFGINKGFYKNGYTTNNFNESLYLLLLLKKSPSYLSSPLLFLKKRTFYLSCKDTKNFNKLTF